MVVSAEYELVTFISSMVTGLLLGVLFDFAKALRAFSKRTLLTDIITWIMALLIFFKVCLFCQSGEIRWYTVLGSFFAWVIYVFTLGKYVFSVLYFLLGKIYLFFCIILKILLTPLGFLCKMISEYVVKIKLEFSKKVEGKCNETKAKN